MTVKRWIGASLNKKQADTLTITGAGATSDTITLTVDNVDFVITIGGTTTTAGIATTVQQAYGGSTLTDTTALTTIPVADGGASLVPQFSEFTATVNGSVVTFTGNGTGALAGKPITMSAAKSGTLTISYSAGATAPTSQYHADQADNYSANGTLANNDTLVFDNNSIDVRWGLSLGVQLAKITKYKSYTGNVGLPEVNTDNSGKPYHNYRTPKYLTTNNNSVTTTADLEVGGIGQGSGRFMWDAGAGQVVLNLYGKGTRIDVAVPCVLFLGSHASNVVNNPAGDLGIAFFGGETATIATLVTGDGPNSQASTICGSGCTLTTVTLNGGQQETNSAITTANQKAGIWVHKAGTVTTLTQEGGFHYPNGSATYTTINLKGPATFDCRRGTASFTITNPVQMWKGSKFYDPQGRSGNTAFVLNGCTLADVTIVIPAGKTITLS